MIRGIALVVAVVVAGGLVVADSSPSATDRAVAETIDDGPRPATVDPQRGIVNVLEIRSTEGTYEYAFTVHGFAQRTRVTDSIRAESTDVVRHNPDGTVTVRGSTGGGQSDAFLFRGTVVSYRQTGGSADGDLVLNGLSVSVDTLRNAHVFEVVSRDEDEEIGYRFTVRGSVEGTTADGHSADEDDEILAYDNGTTVVRGSTGDQSGDAYRIEGTIVDFRRTGGESAFFLRYDGLGFPPEDFGAGDDPPAVGPIGSCTVIDEPGRYELTRDIRNAGDDACIRITVDDVTLDGNGHRVDGVDSAGTVGIDVTPTARRASVESVVVRGVRVRDWGTGVRVGNDRLRQEATNVTVRGVSSVSNVGHGVLLSAATRSRVVDSNVRDNGRAGVALSNLGSDNAVRGTTASGNRLGISVFEGGDGLGVRNNRVTDNDLHGIDTSNDDRDVDIVDNVVSDNGGNGLDLDEGVGITVRGNVVRANDRSGIDFEDVAKIEIVAENTVRANGRYGVVFTSTTDAVVERNSVRDNVANGVALFDRTADVTVRRNTVCGNRDPQILVDSSRTNAVFDNRLRCGS